MDFNALRHGFCKADPIPCTWQCCLFGVGKIEGKALGCGGVEESIEPYTNRMLQGRSCQIAVQALLRWLSSLP